MMDRGGDITNDLGPKELAKKICVYGGVDWPNGESTKAEKMIPLWMYLLSKEDGSRMTDEEYLKLCEFIGRESGLLSDGVGIALVERDEL